jgi:hypothetical protein
MDALHDLLRQLGQHRQGLHVLCDLLHTRRTRDDCADVGVLGTPGQRELQSVARARKAEASKHSSQQLKHL